jgi:hypothetical protein
LAPKSIDLELSLRQIFPQRNTIPIDAVSEELSLTKELRIFAKPLIPFFSEKNWCIFGNVIVNEKNSTDRETNTCTTTRQKITSIYV